MKSITDTHSAPLFCPIVSDFYSGMEVTVPLFASQLCPGKTVQDIKNAYEKKYNGPIVKYNPQMSEDGFISSNGMAMKDSMEVAVYGNDERILLVARYDNLGKGASGAALQCMNIVMGISETEGLDI